MQLGELTAMETTDIRNMPLQKSVRGGTGEKTTSDFTPS
jgi:hypothetical protein